MTRAGLRVQMALGCLLKKGLILIDFFLNIDPNRANLELSMPIIEGEMLILLGL